MRRKNLENATNLMTLIEEELRKCHPFASLYKSAHDQWEAAKEEARANNTALPRVQLTLLNNREARAAHIADPEVHPHRTELPVGVEHVGLVWISATGEPPEFNGIRLTGKEGNIVNMPGHQINPTLFAAFFPSLIQKVCYLADKSLAKMNCLQEFLDTVGEFHSRAQQLLLIKQLQKRFCRTLKMTRTTRST
ncbi:hypothetical protein L596_021750 [Steinernema carpocapsae]|uniref:Uncharacterized protein n=1 Tax=Steinernema carpocapsae TaxID=34508 RepID=A0A4U5MJS1_STECR|nr:hypothetical protein L596_021750 [Steinernema carpocapsae]